MHDLGNLGDLGDLGDFARVIWPGQRVMVRSMIRLLRHFYSFFRVEMEVNA